MRQGCWCLTIASPLAYNSVFLTHSLEALLAILNAKPLLSICCFLMEDTGFATLFQPDAIVHDI